MNLGHVLNTRLLAVLDTVSVNATLSVLVFSGHLRKKQQRTIAGKERCAYTHNVRADFVQTYHQGGHRHYVLIWADSQMINIATTGKCKMMYIPFLCSSQHTTFTKNIPSKHAGIRFASGPDQLGSILARSGPDYSCTPACFRTGSVWAKPDTIT